MEWERGREMDWSWLELYGMEGNSLHARFESMKPQLYVLYINATSNSHLISPAHAQARHHTLSHSHPSASRTRLSARQTHHPCLITADWPRPPSALKAGGYRALGCLVFSSSPERGNIDNTCVHHPSALPWKISRKKASLGGDCWEEKLQGYWGRGCVKCIGGV
ncbi:hypothetical protein CC86DRAFT_86946 [Ophiobolus disseminans]|uniref:Uncharacterized protein n=1 Tax=Ophiobolus disseminans TaxID=1469910 RepID=A0A6A7AHU7_9PLEO|nr:hypothetical protein CC86DRAFT_86946 [Ophiobolus disseminans]